MTTTPDLHRFRELARAGVVVPVVRELAVDGHDPLAAFALLAEDETHAALLETREAADGDADMSVVAPRARAVLTGDDVLEQVQRAVADEVVDIGVELPRFVGGAIGMLAHEFACVIEPTVPRAAAPHPVQLPDATFLLVDTIVVFDHRAARTLAIHAVRVPAGAAAADLEALHVAACAELDRIEAALAGVAPSAATAALATEQASDTTDVATSNLAPGVFEQRVEQAREHVLSGDCVQVVVAQRFETPCTVDPLLAYRALRAMSPAPYHVLLRLDHAHLVGASPEQLVGVHDERVVTHPIAGTRPRGADDVADQRLETELLADPKERCEHMMLVDLGRNDVGRIAEPGTVSVPRLCSIERFSHVMHLVSRVEGSLRPGLHPVDALRSAFPAGTLTGAPKVRAMQRIAELEGEARGAYGGAVGYVGHGRVLDMAITIRTALLAGGTASVQAGAGVVADSVAAHEEAETRDKARAVLAAIARAQRAVEVVA